MKTPVTWVIAPCSPVDIGVFWVAAPYIISALKMGTLCLTETLSQSQNHRRRRIPEDHHPNSHSRVVS
jgi:hypothetical protein